ncbi:unnamed protein product, partial [Trichogramma brassicae]
FWAEAVVTANYIRNRCYTETVGCTPYEKWTGHKPIISHMRSFGEKVHALNKNPTKGKFDRRGLEGVFLGYSYDSKAFRIWLTGARKSPSAQETSDSRTSSRNPLLLTKAHTMRKTSSNYYQQQCRSSNTN